MNRISESVPIHEPQQRHQKTEDQIVHIMPSGHRQHKHSKKKPKNTENPHVNIFKMEERETHDNRAQSSVPAEKEVICLLVRHENRWESGVAEGLVVGNGPVASVHRHEAEGVEQSQVDQDLGMLAEDHAADHQEDHCHVDQE